MARTLLDRLQVIRETLLAEFLPQMPKGSVGALSAEFQTLKDEALAEKWLAKARAVARHCPPGTFEAIRRQLRRAGCALFEGAQGALLDEWRGFHPHSTWSSINTSVVDGVAARFEIEAPIEHYGVIRTYLTRHGPGPLPTHDKSLDRLLPEPHNSGDGWQGAFRRGHPDSVLLRYALEAAGRLSGLFISHLDVFRRGLSLKWCERYSVGPPLVQGQQYVERLPLGASEDLDHQLSLTHLLQSACPLYNAEPIRSAPDFLERITGVTSLPVAFCSYGATCADVREE
jgi:adenylosuccinate synthase